MMACTLDVFAEDRAAAPPPFITRGMPADGQKAMQPLAGDFTVKMSMFGAMGSPDKPATAKVKTHREWVGEGASCATSPPARCPAAVIIGAWACSATAPWTGALSG
jgi:hypothetical protein